MQYVSDESYTCLTKHGETSSLTNAGYTIWGTTVRTMPNDIETSMCGDGHGWNHNWCRCS